MIQTFEQFKQNNTEAIHEGLLDALKTRKQIVKWLRDPHTDSAEYKLWGNGCALPCVYFVVAGIANVNG